MQLLLKLAAALRPGGSLVITEHLRPEGSYNPFKAVEPPRLDFSLLLFTEAGRTLTLSRLDGMLRAAGLKINSAEGNYPARYSFIIASAIEPTDEEAQEK